MKENIIENKANIYKNNGQKQIAGAIILAGLIIAGAVLLKGGSSTLVSPDGKKLLTNATVFNQCLDSGKYAKAVADSTTSGSSAGVTGTPKGFILADGKVVATIDGAEPLATVTQKIDTALAGNGKVIANIKLDPISSSDFALGNPQAKVALIFYADFQCPFCGKFFKETEQSIQNTYVKDGKVQLAYRDFAFLGPESIRSAEAARCAGEQNKFWEYHDYLFTHQKGENQGNFSDLYLKSFAGELKLK